MSKFSFLVGRQCLTTKIIYGQTGGADFVVTRANKKIVVAGAIRIKANSIVEVELYTVEVVLKVAVEQRLNIFIIFIDCRRLKQILSEAKMTTIGG